MSDDDEQIARRVAQIMGDSSAAAAALTDLDRRRSAGIFAWLEFDGRTWWVRGSGSQQSPDPTDAPK